MATLLGDRSSPNGRHHHHHGHHHTHHHQQLHQHQQQYEDSAAYENPPTAYHTHNISDVSSSSASSTASSAFLAYFSIQRSKRQTVRCATTLLLLPPLNFIPLPLTTLIVPSHPRPPNTTTHALTGILLPLQITSSLYRRSSLTSSAANGAGSMGPARTTRARKNNSISGTSPPPFGSP